MAVVKRVEGDTGKKVPAKKSAVSFKKEATAAGLALPTAKKAPDRNVANYTILIHGREKIGKTTWAASFPDALFLMTEPGARGLEVFSFNAEDGGVKNWSIFRAAVSLLVEDGAQQFKTVVIDTVDRAYDLCMDWVCAQKHISHPGDDAYGKAWKAVKDEFQDQIHRILQAGYGLIFTSHAKELTIEERGGNKYTRIQPSMSGQARSVVEALVDFILYAEYAKDQTGNQIRVLICQGDDTVTAGARSTPEGNDFPKILPLEASGGYDTFLAAFNGEDVGLDPSTLLPSKQATETGKTYLKRAKVKGG